MLSMDLGQRCRETNTISRGSQIAVESLILHVLLLTVSTACFLHVMAVCTLFILKDLAQTFIQIDLTLQLQ